MLKLCRVCQEDKAGSLFYKRAASSDGLDGQCKLCKEAEKKIWRANNPDKVKASKARERIKNKDRYNNYQKNWQKDNPEAYQRIYQRSKAKTYGLFPEDIERLLIEQDHQCAICKKDLPENTKHIYIDHCHETTRVRGILCRWCNLGLGNFKDDIHNLEAAIKYLK